MEKNLTKEKLIFNLATIFTLLTRFQYLSFQNSLFDDSILIFVYIFVYISYFFVIILTKKNKLNKGFIIIVLLILYYTSFGLIFINPILKNETFNYFLTNIAYILYISLMLFFSIYYNIFEKIIVQIIFLLGIILTIKLIFNINELSNLSNIRFILNTDERYRTTLGFNHANALGNSSVLLIILIRLKNTLYNSKYTPKIFIFVSYTTLLLSASRNSISSLIIFYMIYYFLYFTRNKSMKVKLTYVSTICFFVLSLFYIAINIFQYFTIDELLNTSNRATIFYTSLPSYLESGRLIQGLGLVQRSIYGNSLTSYNTYWIDNSFFYYLIASGILGLSIIIYILFLILKYLFSNKYENRFIKYIILSMFFMYLYSGIFEVTIFSNAFFSGYIYIYIFLYFITTNKRRFS